MTHASHRSPKIKKNTNRDRNAQTQYECTSRAIRRMIKRLVQFNPSRTHECFTKFMFKRIRLYLEVRSIPIAHSLAGSSLAYPYSRGWHFQSRRWYARFIQCINIQVFYIYIYILSTILHIYFNSNILQLSDHREPSMRTRRGFSPPEIISLSSLRRLLSSPGVASIDIGELEWTMIAGI